MDRAERIRQGIRQAQQQGTRSGRPIGRPRAKVNTEDLLRLRRQRRSWADIAAALGVSTGTVRRAFQNATGAAAPCQKLPVGIL